MSSAPVYNHPNENPLLAPLNQLGNLLNTNYANSWTLRKLIQDNATYILAQLERIRQTVTTLQQNFTNARTQIPQLESQIRDLQTQLDAAQPSGVSGPAVAPDVVALQQQIVNLTAQRNDYVTWVNDSIALINRYNTYVQNINALAPDNAGFTALIGQINDSLRAITTIIGLPQNNPPGQPGNPPDAPGGPYGGPGSSGGLPGPPSSSGSSILSNTGLGGVSSSASSSSSKPSSMWSRFSNFLPFSGKSSGVPIQPGDTNGRYFERLSKKGSLAPSASSVSLNTNATGLNSSAISSIPESKIDSNSNSNRNINSSNIDSDSDNEDDSLGGLPSSSSSITSKPEPRIRVPYSSKAQRDSNMSNVLKNYSNSSSSSRSSSGGKRKRKRTRKQNYKGGFRLNSSKRTTSRTPSSRSSRSSRSIRSSRISRSSRSSRRSSR